MTARGLALAILAWAAVARAEPPPRVELVALAPAGDARQSVALGPHGEAYEPDGAGGWLRRRASTIAGDVTGATRAAGPGAGTVIAATRDGAPFTLGPDAWTVIYLGLHAHAIVGAGPRACAAVGRQVFALDHGLPAALPDAPAPVAALAASPGGVVIEIDRGLLRLDGARWKPLPHAPPHVAALLSDRFALADGGGVVELATGALVAWPAGLYIEAAIADRDRVLAAAAAARGGGLELVTVRAGKVTREPVPLDPPAPVVALAADRAGRIVLATHDGRLVVRDHGAWSTATVRDELPPPRPGAPPARSR